MMRFMRKAALYAVASVVTAGLAFGQMGTFTGKVVGEDGKGMPGVEIKIERKDIKGNWKTKTSKKGDWTYSGMPVPGTFTITCELNGAVMDQLSNVRSQMGEPTELKDFCDIGKQKKRQAAQQIEHFRIAVRHQPNPIRIGGNVRFRKNDELGAFERARHLLLEDGVGVG